MIRRVGRILEKQGKDMRSVCGGGRKMEVIRKFREKVRTCDTEGMKIRFGFEV